MKLKKINISITHIVTILATIKINVGISFSLLDFSVLVT